MNEEQTANQHILKYPKKINRRRTIFIGSAILILAIGLVYVIIRENSNSKALSETSLIKQTGSYMATRQYSKTINLINEQPAATKETLYNQLLLATAYSDMGSYQKALDVYKNFAAKSGWTYTLAADAAQAELSLGQKSSALSYYKQALNLAEQHSKTDIDASQSVYYYEIDINQLSSPGQTP